MSEVEVVVHPEEARKVLTDRAYGAHVLAQARSTVLATARSLAPKRTGAGTAGMDAQLRTEPDGAYVVRVAWSRAQYYMQFQDLGTVHVEAVRFMEQAALRYGGTITGARVPPARRGRRPRVSTGRPRGRPRKNAVAEQVRLSAVTARTAQGSSR